MCFQSAVSNIINGHWQGVETLTKMGLYLFHSCGLCAWHGSALHFGLSNVLLGELDTVPQENYDLKEASLVLQKEGGGRRKEKISDFDDFTAVTAKICQSRWVGLCRQ